MRRIFFVITVLWAAVPATACLWDYDTLRDEKRGMPGIAEVLAGQWERHSRFFYQSRVDRMIQLLKSHPADQDAMDNLAVAYHKLGQTDQAIAVMLDKDHRFPGQYTTYSNLGTFYMLSGDLSAAVAYLHKALAINPNAHFGREEYQLKLAEFLQESKIKPELLDHSFLVQIYCPPTSTTRPTTEATRFDQSHFDYMELERADRMNRDLVDMGFKPNIIEGVVGMLRFGTDQSPELYYALGDLLAFRGDKNLAIRAYKRAIDLHYSHSPAIQKAIDAVSEMQVPKGGLDSAVIAAERTDADKWVADYQQFEDNLIRSGKSTDDESAYAPFYATHGRELKTKDTFLSDYTIAGLLRQWPVTTLVVIVVTSIGVVLTGRWLLKATIRMLATTK